MYVLLVLLYFPVYCRGGGINIVSCPTPQAISNGRVTYTGTSLDDTATYVCSNGYVMTSGDAVQVCLVNSMWSGVSPTCTDMDDVFSFTCDVNGTITAVNPDPSSLIWIQASNNVTICNTIWAADKSYVNITGCIKDRLIRIIFSPFESGVPSLITGAVRYYNITCREITKDGIYRVVTDKSWIRNLFSTSVPPPEVPVIILNSAIEGLETALENVTSDNETTAAPPNATASTTQRPATTVSVNQRLKWRITIPETYIVLVINCTGYSGFITELGSQISMKIIENGCSQALNVITDFQYEYYPLRHIAYADLYTFRFAKSNEIEIVCYVKGCPSTSTACDYNCNDRKRRSDHLWENSDSIEDGQQIPTPYDPMLSDQLSVSNVTNERTIRDAYKASRNDYREVRLKLWVEGPAMFGHEYFENLHSSACQMSSSFVFVSLTTVVARQLWMYQWSN